MLKSKKFWIYAVIIYIAVTANSIMTQYLSENYTNVVKPGWEMNGQAISRLVEIANERRKLGLSYTKNKKETS